MNRILITGEHGYIGNSFAQLLAGWPEEYKVSFLNLRDNHWKSVSLSKYDVIVHTVALVHQKETTENRALYYKINRDLTIELAKKAKSDGVRQFVFLSTGSVYGKLEGTITKDTKPKPVTNYGKSKLEAETALSSLRSADFEVAILRPLMVYGEGCKGNYQSLVKLAKIVPVLPNYKNRRSLVSIETLCSNMKDIVDCRAGGIFFPREREDLCTCEMIQQIAKKQGRHLRCINLLNPAAAVLRRFSSKGQKAFGDLIYQDLEVLSLGSQDESR